MKKVTRCLEENCIETMTSCSTWNGGDIESLGIVHGENLNTIIIEIAEKLESIGGIDFKDYNIDELLAICQEKAPLEITLIGVLDIMKNNQICLKEYILKLEETINELNPDNRVQVNLRCLGDIDNLGNILGVTREQFDDLLVQRICNHETRITNVELGLDTLINQLSTDSEVPINEPKVPTCLDPTLKPVSTQVIKTTADFCLLQQATGNPTDIAAAMANTPADFNTKFGLITGWNLTPANLAESYSNLLLAFNNLLARLTSIEDNCCAIDCESVKVGFSATLNELGDSVILRFLQTSGTKIPEGFTDKGSSGTITDKDGNTVEFLIGIHQDLEEEIYISGLNTTGDLTIDLNVKLGNGAITCDKCLHKTFKAMAGCQYCEITAEGAENSSAVIIYKTSVNNSTVTIPFPEETTTSTTTTTTL